MSLRVPFDQLRAQVAARLEQAGMTAESAAIEARVMAEADLLATPSHGVRMLPALLKAMSDGRVNARPHIRRVRESAASCLIDCDHGAGRHVSLLAMQAAMERAMQFGVGLAIANRASHWGRAHAYAAHAAQAGLVGICMTNAIPNMAGYGATTPILGNNPLAIAVPADPTEEPIVLDIAMSQAAIGKVTTWLREGREVPQGWGVDAKGQPTTDAKQILAGTVLPMGGHKGAGLSLMIDLMTAGLAGGLFSPELAHEDSSGIDPGSSKLFIAVNVAALTDLARFRTRAAEMLSYLYGHTPPGEFLAPSQRGWNEARINREQGVPLHQEIVQQLLAVGVNLRA